MRKTAPKTSNAKKTASKSADATHSRPASHAATSPEVESSENLNLAEIKELIELVSEKQFSEFELERGTFRLRLLKGGAKTSVESAVHVVAAPPPVVAAGPAPVVAAAPKVEAPLAPVAAAPAEEELTLITSPIVGTFYHASSPTAEPFVKVGDPVEVGKTVCIIEAMKLMNEIPAEVRGTVARIFVENGQPVEYGQPLFGLKV
jgi:acetyl-CoA carboxylase biotin carboxyl carrier protein